MAELSTLFAVLNAKSKSAMCYRAQHKIRYEMSWTVISAGILVSDFAQSPGEQQSVG